MLPFEPESFESARARFHRALEFTYKAVDNGPGAGIRPGEVRQNVFDLEDGQRLVVSRRRAPDNSVRLVVSASIRPNSRLQRRLQREISHSDKPFPEALQDALAGFHGEIPALLAALDETVHVELQAIDPDTGVGIFLGPLELSAKDN